MRINLKKIKKRTMKLLIVVDELKIKEYLIMNMIIRKWTNETMDET